MDKSFCFSFCAVKSVLISSNKLDKTIHLLCSELVTSPGLHAVHIGLIPPLLYVLIGHLVHVFGLHIHL